MRSALCVLGLVTASTFVASARQVAPPPALASSAVVEQTSQGTRPALPVLESFDGLGAGFAAGGNAAAQPVGQQPRGRAQPRLPDRQLAARRLHQEGRAVRHDRPPAPRARRHAHAVRRPRRCVRQPHQRRRRGPLRPARPAVAGGHADLPSRGGQDARQPVPPGALARPGEAARRGQASDPGPAARPSLRRRPPPPPGGAASPGRCGRMPSATRSARDRIRSASTTATCSSARCFPTTRAPPSGPTATTCPPASATMSSRRRCASPIARRC